jgi:hypothetical protein
MEGILMFNIPGILEMVIFYLYINAVAGKRNEVVISKIKRQPIYPVRNQVTVDIKMKLQAAVQWVF